MVGCINDSLRFGWIAGWRGAVPGGQMMHQKFLKSWPEAEAGAAMQFAGTFPSFSNF